MGSAELTVLMSTPRRRPDTNPYAAMLVGSLEQTDGVRPEYFKWRKALTTRYDVLHLHWPEAVLRGSTAVKTLGRRVLFLAVLVRAKLLRIPIVRTVHNVELPRDLVPLETFILKTVERWTTLRIRLNVDTPIPAGAPFETIPHGHYRDWYATFPEPDRVPGRVAFFGMIRRYKAVPELAAAFAATRNSMPGLTLHIGGLPSSTELSDALRTAAAADDRVTLWLRALTDEELVREVGEAELVVLPYPEMHNSGATLATLSLDRPVLVPDNAVNRRLDAEVGAGWVFRYGGALRPEHIVDTLRSVRDMPDRTRPDLSNRDSAEIAAAHLRAYRRALSLRRSGTGRRGLLSTVWASRVGRSAKAGPSA